MLHRFRLLILPLLLTVLIVAGCDSDNNSNAQDMEMPGAADCPCFTSADVASGTDGAGVLSCQLTSLGLEFLDDENNTLFGVTCDSDLANCSCTNLSGSQMVDELQADICLMFMTTSILNFDGVEVVSCLFNADL